MAAKGWLERYRTGQREQVWHELRQCGNSVRSEDLATEAQAVCDEMARRARHNVEVLVGRLRSQGYVFHTNDDARRPVIPHHPPSAEAPALDDWLHDRFGPVPMVVSSWIRIVGDVWFVGTHPSWPESQDADPLVIELEGARYPDGSIHDHFEGEYEAWREWSGENEDADGFVLPVAPDRLHKANISGADPYGIRLPDGTAEGLFVGEAAMPFVAYLNLVFRHGGFPAAVPGDRQWTIKSELASGLLIL